MPQRPLSGNDVTHNGPISV